MDRLKLSNEFIKSYPKPEKTKPIFDTEIKNLAIRIRPTGTKSWIYRYSIEGTGKRYTFGRFPQIKIEEARHEAYQLYKKVQQGIDLNVEKKRKQRQQESIRFQDFIPIFKKFYLKDKKETTQKNYLNVLNNQFEGLANVYLSNITKSDVITILDEKAEDYPHMANRMKWVLSSFFSFAKSRDHIEKNFISELEEYPVPNEGKRDNFYTFEEIADIWKAINKLREPYKSLYKVLFLTGQRRAETMFMRWEHLDSKNMIWTIPEELSKNGKEHVIPLAKNRFNPIFNSLKANHSPDSDYVFESNKNKNEPIKSLQYKMRKIRKITGIKSFINHDIRRSVVTHMAGLGISPIIIGKVMNHSGMANENFITNKVYNQHDYKTEKRKALNKWHKKLFAELKKHNVKDLLNQNAVKYDEVTAFDAEGKEIEVIKKPESDTNDSTKSLW